MHRRILPVFLVQLLVMLAVLQVPPAAQSGGKHGDTWDGVYTEAQADRGKGHFTGLCRRCHNDDLGGSERGPALRGETFMSHWELQTASALFAKARDTMPPDSPASLSDQDYLDVVAHVLRANGFPAGNEALKLDRLDDIAIVKSPGGGGRSVPNFALVRVVGCLTPSSANVWTLSQASEPVPTVDQPVAAQKDAEAQPLGTRTFRLVSVASFAPETHKGEKMQARGLLYQGSDKNLLNLVALERLGSGCGN